MGCFSVGSPSGRNWISLPRCRLMWKSRASGGGPLLRYLPRAEMWSDGSQTSVMPQLTAPILEDESRRNVHVKLISMYILFETIKLADLKVALFFFAEAGICQSHLCRKRQYVVRTCSSCCGGYHAEHAESRDLDRHLDILRILQNRGICQV